MFYACRWLLPIVSPPVEYAWFEVDRGRIARLGRGRPPGPAVELGEVAVLPGLVNAHTHLELSWLAGRVPPAASMDAWIRSLMALRRLGPGGGEAEVVRAIEDAIATMLSTGTVLVGDISNTLAPVALLAGAGLGGVVFHELLGFQSSSAESALSAARGRVAGLAASLSGVLVPLRLALATHAPYSVSPALFRMVASEVRSGPLTVHLGESPEEVEFLRTGGGPIRHMLEELGVWDGEWTPPRCGPVAYLESLGYLRAETLAVHAVHLTDSEVGKLARVGATVVTCPRSNLWVGAGMPRVSRFYAAGVRVAIGTDSLASTESLNLFDELAELRRIAPDVTAAALLESATRSGAEALGFASSHGAIAPGMSAAVIAVDVPSMVRDVEEYLVEGVPPAKVRRVH